MPEKTWRLYYSNTATISCLKKPGDYIAVTLPRSHAGKNLEILLQQHRHDLMPEKTRRLCSSNTATISCLKKPGDCAPATPPRSHVFNHREA
ncbi:hypothetical protein RRG08_057669 [Elysia crispata]|uniref:Uncharacterized protein n=1 Tax=Elysia crispata TaxID=231223 RepID=A0AAE0XRT8_9GAST|nr:hypothetical protein RRG08_057669 [Elysia crispata]